MGFDWLTFIAQIINLFVLVWILKRFLYQPVLKAIDRRQAYVLERVQKAREEHELAQKKSLLLDRQRALFESNRQRLLDKTYQEAERLKKQQSEKLRAERALLRQKMQADLAHEANALQLETRNLIAAQFNALSLKIMTELSGLTPIQQALLLFRKKAGALKGEERAFIRKAIIARGAALMNVSDKLTRAQAADLAGFIRQKFRLKDAFPVQIQTDESLILGIELIGKNASLEWNVRSCLQAFETQLNAVLQTPIAKE